VLVVGGGDSALEAAASVAEQPGTEATLAYRGAAFARAKARNRARVEEAARSGRLRLLLSAEVTEIEPDAVRLRCADRSGRLANDSVIVCAGGILPSAFLSSIGVAVETKYGTA
jgi:thioredoxin reductase